MEERTQYVAEDGSLFSTKDAAARHDFICRNEEKIIAITKLGKRVLAVGGLIPQRAFLEAVRSGTVIHYPEDIQPGLKYDLLFMQHLGPKGEYHSGFDKQIQDAVTEKTLAINMTDPSTFDHMK